MKPAKIVKNPLVPTYEKKGFTSDEIVDDAIQTVMERIYSYSDEEREMRGFTEDFFSKNNLKRMYQDDRINFIYNNDSGSANPAYDIAIDVDGDGGFQMLTYANNRNALFRPEKKPTRYNSYSTDQLKFKTYENYINNWFEESAGRKEFLKDAENDYYARFNIKPKTGIGPVVRNLTHSLIDIFVDGGKEGIKNVEQMFNSIPFLPNVQVDVNAINDIQQKAMLAELDAKKVIAELGEELPLNIMNERQIKFEDSQVPMIMKEPFADSILPFEGFSSTIYNAKDGNFGSIGISEGKVIPRTGQTVGGREPHVEGSKISKEQYLSITGPKADPTIGHGINMKEQINLDIIESIKDDEGNQKYTIEGLMNGTEEITQLDSLYVFYKRVAEKVKIADSDTKMYDLTATDNALLTVAITNLAYLGGGFNGPKFYTALNNYKKTGDIKYIGEFKPYQEGDEFSVGQELYTDALQEKEENNMGGYMDRFNHVHQLILAWANGQKTQLPQYAFEPELLLNKS